MKSELTNIVEFTNKYESTNKWQKFKGDLTLTVLIKYLKRLNYG